MRKYIIAFLMFWHCFAIAQLNGKYNFRHIDQSDGLLHTSVKSVGQDAKGFIWILTFNGLQRYDGSRFVDYPEALNQSSFNVIFGAELYVDTVNNSIWVIKGDKMERLDLSNNKISTIQVKDMLSRDSLYQSYLFTNNNQDQWLIGEYGVIHYEKNTQTVIGAYINFNPGQSYRHTFVLKDPVSGEYWTHNFNHFFIADLVTKKIYSSADPDADHPLLAQLHHQFGESNEMRFVMQDSYHNVWISTWKHYLLRYNLDTKKLFTYSLKDVKKKQKENEEGDITLLINAIYEDRQKNIWFATDYAGLLRYDTDRDDFDFITSDEKISNGLRYNYSIYSIFQDRDDNIWLGTDRGISIFNPYRNYFQSVRHIDGNNASLSKHDINDVIETQQGEILIATWGGGISFYDRQWNFIRNVKFTGPNEYNLVWCFVQNDNGMIWAGCQHGYIHMYDPVKRTFSTIQPKETDHSTILTMTKDQAGNILMGLNNGKMAIWNKEEKLFYGYNDIDPPVNLIDQPAKKIYVDKSNHCWAATYTGLKEFDIQKRVFTNYHPLNSADSTSGLSVQGIEEYNDSMLIVGAIFGGLHLFNTNTKKYSNFPINEHLNTTSVYAIKKDDEGNFWFTTNYSLHKIYMRNTQTIQYNIDHSIISTAFGSDRFYELNDGRWITSTPAEIICFKPKQIGTIYASNREVAISGFKVFDEYIYIDSFLAMNKPVLLPYHKNFISIEFSALDFTRVQQTNYDFRLSNVDKNWIHSTTKQFADYTDLKPGEYLFEVKAENGNGSSGITSFPIIITSPWWATIWFRILCIIVIASIMYLAFKKRIDAVRKEAQWKQKIAETEMVALRSQMNPHFIFNCLSSIDNLIQTNQKEKATNYLAKFAQLIRAILENSKSNVIPCWKDLEALKLYLDMESLRWDGRIICQFHIDPLLQQGDYKVPPMIIQPFVENAIHHGLLNKLGPDKKLDISAAIEGDNIKYSIIDNGVGRQKAGQYKTLNRSSHISFGIQITNERVSLFNQNQNPSVKITDLYDGQHEPTGTKVEVWLTTLPITI